MKVVRDSSYRSCDRVPTAWTDDDFAWQPHFYPESLDHGLIGFICWAEAAARRRPICCIHEHGSIAADLRRPKLVEIRRRATVRLPCIPRLPDKSNPACWVQPKNL